jgi:hypothetical protein
MIGKIEEPYPPRGLPATTAAKMATTERYARSILNLKD